MNPLQFWYWENNFNRSQLKEINKIIKEKEDKQYKDAPARTVKKVANVTGVEYRHLKNILHDTFQRFNLVNKYNFGYSLFEPNDFDNFLHTEYNSKDKGEYDWHIDDSNNYIYDVKFTVLINTSLKKYEGGEFFLYFGKPVLINKFSKPGDIIMFKSSIYHKVNPVTKGSRNTLAFFLKGPRFI